MSIVIPDRRTTQNIRKVAARSPSFFRDAGSLHKTNCYSTSSASLTAATDFLPVVRTWFYVDCRTQEARSTLREVEWGSDTVLLENMFDAFGAGFLARRGLRPKASPNNARSDNSGRPAVASLCGVGRPAHSAVTRLRLHERALRFTSPSWGLRFAATPATPAVDEVWTLHASLTTI